MAFESKEIHFKSIQQTHMRGQGSVMGGEDEERTKKEVYPRSCALWKHPRCPLMTEEWIKKWYIYILEYYPAIKKNKIVPVAT